MALGRETRTRSGFIRLSARTCPAPAGLHGEAVPSRPGAGLAALTRGERAGSELKCGLRVFFWGTQAPPELFPTVSRLPGGVGERHAIPAPSPG